MDISIYIKTLSEELGDNAFKASDALARIASEEVVQEMIKLLNHPMLESRYMAARTLALMANNAAALNPILVAIQHKENAEIAGDLVLTLEAYDVSAHYVDIFKLFLFGSFKVSLASKDLLDHQEFDITTRVIRKARKHWEHYTNNVKHDEVFDLQKIEVEGILNDLDSFVSQP